MLLHDLAHFAVEVHSQTPDGFFALLASGATLSALRENQVDDPAVWDALMVVEGRVARLQSSLKHTKTSSDPALPLLKRAWGSWRKVRMGETLVLSWPSGDLVVRG